MPDATITSTASTFGTITGTFLADQSTITGTVTGVVVGTLDGSVGVPGIGVPDGGTTGQVLKKASNTSYDTVWGTDLNAPAWGNITGTLSSQTDLQTALDAKAPLASPAFTGNPTAPTAALADNDTSIATTAFVQQELASGVAVAKNLEVYVRNQTGSTLTAGTIVYINGATGNRPTVTKAQANNDANSAQTFGFVKASIANNGFGYVIVRGECENLDTSALTEGAQLYLSPTTAGTWTTTKPSAPQHLVYVGIVVRAHPTQGVILVAIQNGYELNEIHDVLIDTPSNGQVLKYDAAQGLWINGTDSSGVAWGGITGTLSSQTDLQTALDAKLPKSGGVITGDIQSNNGSEYRTWDGLYNQVNISSSAIQLIDSDIGGGALAIEPSGITFNSSPYKQTEPFLGLSGYATESWVTSGFYPLTGNPSGFITSAALSPYLTSATAAATYQTIAGMSSYLTTSAAASTYYPLTNPSGFITTSALTGYATETWVTNIGYLTDAPSDGSQYARKNGAWDVVTPATNYITSVQSPLAVTSGDLTVDLSAYETTANAAATYYLQTNPSGFIDAAYLTTNNYATQSWVTGQNYITTAALSPYAPLSGASFSGLIVTAASSTSVAGFKLTLGSTPTSPVNGSMWGTSSTLYFRINDISETFAFQSWVTSQLSGYATTASLSSYAPLASPALTGTPTSTTAAADTNTTQIATTAYVVGQASSTSPVMDGSATVGTSLKYARADHVHPTDTSRAPLASPALTGTPTAPTASVGTNTTQIATTAFVTAAVPAFATVAQSRAATSTTTSMNPSVAAWQLMHPGTVDIARGSLTYTATGTMGGTGTGFLVSRMTLGTAGACSANFRTFGGSQIDQTYGLWSKGYRSYIDFSKFIWCSGRFYTEDNINDPNVTVAFYCGKAQNSANGDLARAGFGWKFSGNATAGNRLFVVCAHNGTTLTTVTSSFAIVAQQYVDWDVVSNGSGTVTLYINGTQVATTTGGPTADTSYSGTAPVIWNEEMLTTGTSAGFNATFGRGRIYMAP